MIRPPWRWSAAFLHLLLLFFRVSQSAKLLPFGEDQGDQVVRCVDASSTSPILLPRPFFFFERSHSTISISCNGAIVFDSSLFDSVVKELDAERKDVIAIFYAPSRNSSIFYRMEPKDSPLALKFTNNIRRAFSDSAGFDAEALVLITWDNVKNVEANASNAYQLVLAVSNSSETFATFIYNQLQWVQSDSQFAQVGFFSADGKSEKLLNSATSSIGNLMEISNFNENGLFVFKISGSHPIDPKSGQDEEYEYEQEQQEYQEDQISECPPDPQRDNCPPNCNIVLDDRHCSLCICSSVVSDNLGGPSYSKVSTNDIGMSSPPHVQQGQAAPEGQLSSSGRNVDLSCSPTDANVQCSPSASCSPFERGHCCECRPGQFGNGVECLPVDGAIRMNGFFEGAFNGKQIQKTELFVYIQIQKGEQHTAVTRLPRELGWSLLLLDPIANVIGWLFAKSNHAENPNGFQLTGANFTRIVNIHLGDRYSIVMRQEFTDRKSSDVFNVNVIISGTIPEFEEMPQVTIPDYEETFRRERPGLIRAYSERYLSVRERSGEEEKRYRITTDQQIQYTECPNRDMKVTSQIIRFEHINVQYSEKENLVRFASQSVVLAEPSAIPVGQQHPEDPCANNFCKPGTVCVPMGHTYRCECKPGYHFEQDNTLEAGEDKMQCVADSQEPRNIEAGEVVEAASADSCTRHDQCHKWGECVKSEPNGPGKCKCRGWMVGDGVTECGPPKDSSAPPSDHQPPPPPPGGTICRNNNECGENGICQVQPSGYYICVCTPPYRGDGVDCTLEDGAQQSAEKIEDNGKKQCSDQTDCHPNGHCVLLDAPYDRYFCECLPGFRGDGFRECDRSDCNPSDAQSCGPNEQCLFEADTRNFACKCLNGFTRIDGTCIPSVVSPDQQLPMSEQCKSCATNAQCIRQQDGQWNCICNAGFTGNGFECRPEEERVRNCFDDRSLCSPHAQCIPDDSRSTYVCSCNYGYRGNGRNCEPILDSTASAASDASLLVARGMSIIQRSAQPADSGKQLVVWPHQVVVDIDYDCVSGRIFWSDIAGHVIRSSALNGTDINTNFAEELRSPEGIAIDWSSRNIYYADSIRNEIGVLSIDGRYQKGLLKEGLSNPRALVIDLDNRHLYYSDWARESPKIGRIDLDGTNNQAFISTDINLPNGMTLLPTRKWLCWVDAGSQKLSCIGLDGRDRRVVHAPLEYPFGLTCYKEERFYWTDWKDYKIHSISVYGSDYLEFLPGAGGKGKVYGILSLPLKCQGAPTECRTGNGGCAHLCLPRSRSNSIVCACPDNVKGLEGC